MKILENRSILKKILLVLVIIILFEFSMPNNVSKAESGWGGTLFTPIQGLVLALGDVCELALNFSTGFNVPSVLTLSKTPDNTSKIVQFFTGVTGKALNLPTNKIVKSICKLTYKFSDEDFIDEMDLPVLNVTPEKIFSNEVPLLDVNIISPTEYKDENGKEIETPVSVLQSTISAWYRILRDIVVVAFLSVLVYVGIRIIISSAAEEKSKYKQLLTDWVVGLCLLFAMHYIMSFAMIVTEKITDFVDIDTEGIVIESDINLSEQFEINDEDTKKIMNIYNIDDENNPVTDRLSWHTDLAGFVRFNAQTNINSSPASVQMAYTLMYVVLVIYTLIFLVQYLKRLFNIVLLTLISPVIALAYPLDKLADGKAQAFNMWIKEYIFNLLLQPMHLILYSVLVGSAVNLVTDHPLYGIIVLACLLQAEKLIRKLFGFDKAGTMGSASSGALTGAVVMHGLNSIVNRAKNKEKTLDAKSSSGKGSSSNDNVRMVSSRGIDNPDQEDDFMFNALGGASEAPQNANDNGNTNIEPDPNSNLDSNEGPTPVQSPDTNSPEVEDPNVEDSGDNLNVARLGLPGSFEAGNDTNNGNNSADGIDVLQPNNSPIFDTNDDNIIDVNEGDYRTVSEPRTVQAPTENKDTNKETNKTSRKKDGKRKIKDRIPAPVKTGARVAGAAAKLGAPKAAKTVFKGAAMAVGAGTLGMVGVAAGLASDDATNVLKYGAAGISGGALVGNVAAKGAMRAPSAMSQKINAAREEIARETYRDDPKGYKQYLNKRADKQFLNDKEVKREYEQAFGKSKAVEMMNNAIEYRTHGITDNQVIIKAMKETSGEIGRTSAIDPRRIAAAKLASGVTNSKDLENMTKRLKKQGFKQNIIDENEEFVRSIKGFKYN